MTHVPARLIARFRARFDAPLAVLHSNLSDGERLAAWRSAGEGRVSIVIGTRSAVFSPLARPGLIVVDEEHDASFKQQEGFRYSARDLAIVRAQRLGIPVVLGSATPSLESLHRAQRQPQWVSRLPQRAANARVGGGCVRGDIAAICLQHHSRVASWRLRNCTAAG